MSIDGARLGNALARLDVSPAEATWRSGIDVLSFGATKGGALAAEAVVFFDAARAANMSERRKRAGHLLPKHRFAAAQFEAYLAGDFWLKLARHANAMADRRARCYLPPMASILSTFILPVAAGAVALVLLLGLVNMMRGGSPNTSQKLMRWRVLLQFVAIVIAMIAVWAMGR